MPESPVTRATLLLRLRDGQDNQAWSEFLRDYGLMLYRFIRKRGIQDADAADILQDVLRRVGSAIPRLEYDKEKGGFRAWLFTITRNCLYTYFEQRQRIEMASQGTDAFRMIDQTVDASDSLEEQWQAEYMRQLAARAMTIVETEVEPNTWQAFHGTAVEGLPAAEVGRRIGMSTGAVYVAKSRVLARLRVEIERMEQEEVES